MRNRYKRDINRLVDHPRRTPASRRLRSPGGLNSVYSAAAGLLRTPPALSVLKSVTLACGDDHFACILEDGSLHVSGYYNSYGVNSDVPTGSDFVSVAAGQFSVAAIRVDGSVEVWGDTDYSGGLTGTPGASVYGVRSVPPGLNAVDIAATSETVAVVNADGTLVVWGDDVNGLVSEKPSGSDFIMVSGSRFNYVALRSDGTVVCWGVDNVGETIVPANLAPATFVNSAKEGSHAIENDGVPRYWGWTSGFGIGLPAMPEPKWIRAGTRSVHGIAIDADGNLESFGHDPGSLGLLSPPSTAGFSIGDTMTDVQLAIKKDGSFVWWGDPSNLSAPLSSVKQPTFGWF